MAQRCRGGARGIIFRYSAVNSNGQTPYRARAVARVLKGLLVVDYLLENTRDQGCKVAPLNRNNRIFVYLYM